MRQKITYKKKKNTILTTNMKAKKKRFDKISIAIENQFKFCEEQFNFFPKRFSIPFVFLVLCFFSSFICLIMLYDFQTEIIRVTWFFFNFRELYKYFDKVGGTKK